MQIKGTAIEHPNLGSLPHGRICLLSRPSNKPARTCWLKALGSTSRRGLPRAIGWGQKSFCVNCATSDKLIGAVDAAWGVPVRNELNAAAAAAAKAKQDKAIAASTKKR
jgi:hypothetical protein